MAGRLDHSHALGTHTLRFRPTVATAPTTVTVAVALAFSITTAVATILLGALASACDFVLQRSTSVLVRAVPEKVGSATVPALQLLALKSKNLAPLGVGESASEAASSASSASPSSP